MLIEDNRMWVWVNMQNWLLILSREGLHLISCSHHGVLLIFTILRPAKSVMSWICQLTERCWTETPTRRLINHCTLVGLRKLGSWDLTGKEKKKKKAGAKKEENLKGSGVEEKGAVKESGKDLGCRKDVKGDQRYTWKQMPWYSQG